MLSTFHFTTVAFEGEGRAKKKKKIVVVMVMLANGHSGEKQN